MSVLKRTREIMRIGTHNGTFHCDEALACFMLKLLPRFAGAEIVRTRNPDELAKCDVVVDVGGVYDPEKLRFDHHQREFAGTLSPAHNTKLSSAGLIYKHFGAEIIQHVTKEKAEHVEELYQKVYERFVEAVDAIDNGISLYDTKEKPRYHVSTDLSSRVGNLNPWWCQEETPEQVDARFLKAMALTGEEFLETVNYFAKAWLPAREIVVQAVQARNEVDPSGELVLFEGYAPWKEHLHELEEKLELGSIIKYALYPDQSGAWRVQAVPEAPGSFSSRLPLPEPWRGIRDADLDKLTGIDGCVFVHSSGFIGGNKTREGALAMARAALTFKA